MRNLQLQLSKLNYAMFMFILVLNVLSYLFVFFHTHVANSELADLNQRNAEINRLLESLNNLDASTSNFNLPSGDSLRKLDLEKERKSLASNDAAVNAAIAGVRQKLTGSLDGASFENSKVNEIQSLSDLFVKQYNEIFAQLEAQNYAAVAEYTMASKSTLQQMRQARADFRRQIRRNADEIEAKNNYSLKSYSTFSTNVLFINFLLSLLLAAGGSIVYLRNKKSGRVTELYKKALEQSSIFGVMDVNGKLTYVNKAFLDICGLTETELIGKSYKALNITEISSGSFLKVWKTLKRAQTWQGEMRSRRADGSTYWTQNTVVPLIDSKGKAEQYVVIRFDITARKEMEAGLIYSKDQAERASRVKSDFLANMSHEIRTPMNAIIGMADLLDGTQLNDDQKRYVTIFKKAGANLVGIINDILDISKIESGHMNVENLNFNLRALVEEVVEISLPMATKKGLDLICQISPDIAEQYGGDALRVRQILMNLIGNAIKFTEMGIVTVNLTRNLNDKRPGNLHFSVTDTGIGIPRKKQEALFQAFTQADSSVTKKYGGTGLGLAISKKLTEMMGGEIWIESEMGVGSVFNFTLNFEAATPSAESGMVSELPAAVAGDAGDFASTGRKVKILLVDDSDDNLTLVKEYFKKTNAEICEAENGKVAYERFISDKFDLVFMDMQMPVLDGQSATRMIREWETENGLDRTPIVALTAYALKEETQKCLNAGCDAYLSKPVKKSALFATVENWTNGSIVNETKTTQV